MRAAHPHFLTLVLTAGLPAPADASPPADALAPVPRDCIGCAAAYEGMPQRLQSAARIAAPAETGERLSLTGRTLGPDGLPRAGIILYASQEDDRGTYRAWVRTDASGLFTFDTIVSADMPEGTRIQIVVIEPGCAVYRTEDIRFSGAGGPGSRGTIVPQRDLSTGRLYATRDIHLGRGVRDYPACGARPDAHPSTENP